MKAIQIIKEGFDSMENHSPWHESVVAIIVDSPDKNRSIKAGEWLKEQKITLYAGWDGQVYPKFKLKEIEVI